MDEIQEGKREYSICADIGLLRWARIVASRAHSKLAHHNLSVYLSKDAPLHASLTRGGLVTDTPGVQRHTRTHPFRRKESGVAKSVYMRDQHYDPIHTTSFTHIVRHRIRSTSNRQIFLLVFPLHLALSKQTRINKASCKPRSKKTYIYIHLGIGLNLRDRGH